MKTKNNIQQLISEIRKALGRLNETAQETVKAKVFKLEWKGEKECTLSVGVKTIATLSPEKMLDRIWEIENKLNENHK